METQNKLSIEHIAKRLPYGLNGKLTSNFKNIKNIKIIGFDGSLGEGYVQCFENELFYVPIYGVKPILYPPILNIPITLKGKSFIPIDELEIEGFIISVNSFGIIVSQEHGHEFGHVMDIYNNIILKLLEWHIDTDGLIESGLAVSVFDLDKNPYA